MLKILFLAADPQDQARLRLMEEHRNIDERIRASPHRNEVQLATRLAVRTVDLTQALLDEQPTVVHFSGHGASGAICLQNDSGATHPVESSALGSLFSLFSKDVRCVVLNACYSEDQARAIGEHIDYVIGMSNSISDDAAIAYSVGFYAALAAGRSVEDAHRFGLAQIDLEGLHETGTPVLHGRTSLGSPVFVEPPAPKAPNYRDLVLLISNDAGVVLIRSKEIKITETVDMTIAPDAERETAYVTRLQAGASITVVFGSTAVICELTSTEQHWTSGEELWRLRGRVDKGPYGPSLGEMSGFGHSADDLAILRARRILLDERLSDRISNDPAAIANQMMLEVLVRGVNVRMEVVQSPLPALYNDLRKDPELFLVASRLIAIAWLRLSGVVEEVQQLKLSLDGAKLHVTFTGRRGRRYTNVEPAVIAIEGTCDLTREARPEDLRVPAVREIMFESSRWYDFDRGGVGFSGEADGQRIVFFISREALQDYFASGVSKEELLQTFDNNAPEIHRIATRLLAAGRLDEEKRVFIRTVDIASLR